MKSLKWMILKEEKKTSLGIVSISYEDILKKFLEDILAKSS